MTKIIPVLILLSFAISAESIEPKNDWYNIDGHQLIKDSHSAKLGTKSFYLASYTYLPKNKPIATVVTVHGYLVNCHYLLPIHEYLLKNNYKVVCVEMPGLGQSSGPRALIENFDVYQDFINELPKISPDPDYLIVHSTGAVGVLENLFEKKSMPYKHIFLIGPLVRNQKYVFTNWAYWIGKHFLTGISRDPKSAKYKSEKLNALHRADPYWINETPVAWIGKLIDWNKKIEKMQGQSNAKNITIFYGSEDRVVDTPYNSKFLKKKLPKADHQILKGASHYPFWDPNISQSLFKELEIKLKR